MTDSKTICGAKAQVPPSPPSNGWEPIETAPKDGKDILLANRFGAWSSAWAGDDWRSYYYSEPPTHWMHLPAPPVESPTESGVMEEAKLIASLPDMVRRIGELEAAMSYQESFVLKVENATLREEIDRLRERIKEIEKEAATWKWADEKHSAQVLAFSAEIERLRNVAANAALDGLETTIGAAAENAALRERIKELEAAMGYQESFALKVENATLRERIAELEGALEDMIPYAQATIGIPETAWPPDSVILKARALLSKAKPEQAP